MDAPDTLATFTIDAKAGTARVAVNGQDITPGLQAIRVEFDVDHRMPVLTIQRLASAGSIEGQGIVRVSAEGEDPMEAVVQFLADVDPNEVQERALRGHSASQSMTAQIIRVLGEMAAEP